MSAVAASQMYGGTCRCNALCCTRLSGPESGRDTPCSAGIVLSDQRICHSQTIRPRTCVPPALPRPPVCHRQGRTADIISVRRGCPLTAVVTVQMLLYHVCNRFARLFGRLSPNFCISAQFFVWKSVAFLRISEETEQDSSIQIVTFSEILSYFRLAKQKKSGDCRTGKTIFCKKWSYCR